MKDWTTPPDFVPGCLPRTSEVGEWFPRASDRIDVISASEVADRIELLIDTRRCLRFHIPAIGLYDQDGVGSCTLEGAHGALKLKRAAEGQPFVEFNPWPGYGATGSRDTGRNIDRILVHMRENGAIPEELWPRYRNGRIVHRWNERLPDALWKEQAPRYRVDEWLDVENWEEARTCLLQLEPVVFGHDNHAEVMFCCVDRDHFGVLGSWGKYSRYPRPFPNLPGCHIMHRRDIEWGYGAWSPVSAVDAGDIQ
jgi:hypothetical protein